MIWSYGKKLKKILLELDLKCIYFKVLFLSIVFGFIYSRAKVWATVKGIIVVKRKTN